MGCKKPGFWGLSVSAGGRRICANTQNDFDEIEAFRQKYQHHLELSE
jgi:hypothetical protein